MLITSAFFCMGTVQRPSPPLLHYFSAVKHWEASGRANQRDNIFLKTMTISMFGLNIEINWEIPLFLLCASLMELKIKVPYFPTTKT